MQQILEHRSAVHQALQAFIRQKQATAHPASREADFLERLLPFAGAGKLLRGSLVCFSYEVFSGRLADAAVINTAVALELTHSALLIHDDVMDGDELRRGRPSLHRQYQILGQELQFTDSRQFGVSMAVCGGDIALFLALELLPPSAEARQLFVDQLIKTCSGQMQDVYLEARPKLPAKRAIYEVMAAKTAAYTLALPLMMGAALAGQPAAVQRRWQRLGTAPGTIFQIRDDELGVTGDTKMTGKPVGADIREGKKTLIYYYLFKKCSAQERQRLKNTFGNPGATNTDITYTQQLITRHRIPQLLNTEVKPLQKQSLVSIKQLTVPSDAKAELKSLVDFCSRRQA
jgi:geranylgeranyl diphosphate synthase, type I